MGQQMKGNRSGSRDASLLWATFAKIGLTPDGQFGGTANGRHSSTCRCQNRCTLAFPSPGHSPDFTTHHTHSQPIADRRNTQKAFRCHVPSLRRNPSSTIGPMMNGAISSQPSRSFMFRPFSKVVCSERWLLKPPNGLLGLPWTIAPATEYPIAVGLPTGSHYTVKLRRNSSSGAGSGRLSAEVRRDE